MFIPYKIDDDGYDFDGFPWLVCIIIAACVVAHVVNFEFLSEADRENIFYQYGCTPIQFRWWNTITCTFLHGDAMHLVGNMLFFWVYGPLCEKGWGRIRFLVLYIVGAVVSVGGHVLTVSTFFRDVPCIGASGAISAVLGAFLVTFPNVRIKFLVLSFLYPRPLPSSGPAWFVLGCWFIVQIFYSLNLLGGAAEVAFWAHICGFAAGAGLAALYLWMEDFRVKHAVGEKLKALDRGEELTEDDWSFLYEQEVVDSPLLNAAAISDPDKALEGLIEQLRQARTAHDDGKALFCYYRLLCLFGADALPADLHVWSAGAAVRLRRPGIAKYAYFQAIRLDDGTYPSRDRLLSGLANLYEKIDHDLPRATRIRDLLARYYPNSEYRMRPGG